MTNNDRLLLVQDHLNLNAHWVAEACYCKLQTVYTWRKKIKGEYYRSMPDSAWQLLSAALVQQGKVSTVKLDAILHQEKSE